MSRKGSNVVKDEEAARMEKLEQRYLARAVTPLKAIRAKCVQCVGLQPRAIASCAEKSCALHPFRMGSNPYHFKDKNGKKSTT